MKGSNENSGIVIAILTIAAISILLSVWNLSNNSTNQQRINTAIEILKNDSLTTYGRDSLIVKLNNYQFKEDFYDKQLDIQSNWFIAFVTILFAMFGFFGYSFFVNRIDEIEKNAEKYRQEQDNKMRAHDDEFKKLRIQNLNQQSSLSNIASTFFYNEGRFYDSIKNGLMSVSYRMMAINSPEYEKYKPEVVEIANEYLTSVIGLISTHKYAKEIKGNFLIANNYEIIFTVLDDLLKFENTEIKEKIIDIMSILKAIKNSPQN